MRRWKRQPHLKKQLKAALKKDAVNVSDSGDQLLLREIVIRTNEKNLNNLTRTKAYLEFYMMHPEIHWALLAHLVSRNAGWNMTDLKGEYHSKLLTDKEQFDFFSFLERANWLIFQDAYPQLLLYEKAKKANLQLHHLLPGLHVSSFMLPIWNHFHETHDSCLLTKALIINEQNYIESRVVQNHHFRQTILNQALFKLQDLFEMNPVLFPYTHPGQTAAVGLSVHHFSSLDKRIDIGKQLYQLLFSDQQRLSSIRSWAVQHPHTGSRKDFWPNVFRDERITPKTESTLLRKQPCHFPSHQKPLYSPLLTDAWGNSRQLPPEGADWFKHIHSYQNLYSRTKSQEGTIIQKYCDQLAKLDFAVYTKASLQKKEHGDGTLLI